MNNYGKCKLSFFVWYISRCSQILFEPRRDFNIEAVEGLFYLYTENKGAV